MSNAIMSWAKTQMTGSPSAQCVLYCLADEASTHGECWTSQETLARETQQSVDSVQRRLRDLEKAGFIYCVSRRHWGDSGKWRTNMIIVLAEAICVSFALKHGYDPAVSGAVSGENEILGENQGDGEFTVPQIAVVDSVDCNENKDLGEGEKGPDTANCGTVESGHRTAPVAVRTVPHSCGTRTITLEPYSPQSPPLRTAAALDGGSWLGEWGKLVEVWPPADGESLSRSRERFRVLTPEERAAVLQAAPAYLADCRAKQRRPMRLKGFLAGDWRHWASVAEGLAKARARAAVFVVEHSRAWTAWAARLGEKMPRAYFASGRKGWAFPSLFPPGAATEGYPETANVAAAPPPEAAPDGVFLGVETAEFAAWAAHYARAGEAPPFAYFHPKQKVRGSLFAARWPPGDARGAGVGDGRSGAAGLGNRENGSER